MNTKFKYGSINIDIALPANARCIKAAEPSGSADADIFKKNIIRSLDVYIDKYGKALGNTAVVIADKTRLCSYPKYLPILLETLKKYKASPLTVFIAYGTHKQQTDEQSLACYGDSYLKYRFIHHDCFDKKLFALLGQTNRKTDVYIRKDILNADFLITFGALSFHYFAGYGGGRKLIFPGLGYIESVYQNHKLFLDTKNKKLSAYCNAGETDKNPVALDLKDFESFCPADLAFHAVLDSSGEVRNIITELGTENFYKICKTNLKAAEYKGEFFDMVIASCGGFPKDINFIQAHKSLNNAARFVKDGGYLIFLAQCSQKIGSNTFMPYFDYGFDKAFSSLLEKYEGNGGTALSMMSKAKRINIFIVTELNEEYTKIMRIKKISAEKAIEMVRIFKGSIAAIPNAAIAF